MASAAERLADATYVELRGTHFMQMEQPERVHQLLLDFLERVSWHLAGRRPPRPPGRRPPRSRWRAARPDGAS